MKKLILISVLLMVSINSWAEKNTWIGGYLGNTCEQFLIDEKDLQTSLGEDPKIFELMMQQSILAYMVGRNSGKIINYSSEPLKDIYSIAPDDLIAFLKGYCTFKPDPIGSVAVEVIYRNLPDLE